MQTKNKDFVIEEFNNWLDNIINFVKHENDSNNKYMSKQNSHLVNGFREKFDMFNLLSNISKNRIYTLKTFSFLNFLRYFEHFVPYFKNDNFYSLFEIKNQECVLTIRQKNDKQVSLLMRFQSNGIIKFLSLDRDNELNENENENQKYVFTGEFCTSNLIRKNSDIKRLLAIIDY